MDTTFSLFDIRSDSLAPNSAFPKYHFNLKGLLTSFGLGPRTWACQKTKNKSQLGFVIRLMTYIR